MTLQPPRLTDALEIWRLCPDVDARHQHSTYFYALWCRDFSTTSVVAKSEDGICVP